MTKGVRSLKKYRFDNDLTQQEFADKFEFNRSTIASIESGTTKPSVTTAQALSSVIGIKWYLFFEEEK